MDTNPLLIAQAEVGRRMTGLVDEALQIFGGYGYVAEQAIQHYYRGAWAIRTSLGTEEELKDLLTLKRFGKER